MSLLVPLVLSAFVEERAELERGRASEVRSAAVAAENGAATIDAFLRDLENTTLTLALTLADADLRASGPLLASVAREYPELRSMFATDAAGRVVAASSGEGLGTDLATRPYMVRLRQGEDRVWSGSLSGLQSGEITVAYGRRVGTATAPRGYLVVAFYPERVLRGVRLRLPADARVRILDERGTPIYATDPAPPTDADIRVTAPVSRTGWTMEILRSHAQLEVAAGGDATLRVLQRASLIAALALAASWLAFRIARPIRRLTRHADAIARGERPDIPPTGGGPEIAALADAMRTMQAAIAQREDEAARLDRELRDALRSRDEFMAATGHDVRTPLTVLRATAELLKRRVAQGQADAGAIEEAMDRIRSAAQRVEAQLAQLVDLSRARAGQPIELQRVPTDLVALAVRVRLDFQDISPGHRITLDTQADRLVGMWDETRVERALTNILSNAVKFSPAGSTVGLRIARDGDDAVVEVHDHGVGIPRDEIDRVLTPFSRGSNAAGVDGSGIGLAVVEQVAATHGGRLEIESEEGRGTTVRLRLPLAHAPAGEPATTAV